MSVPIRGNDRHYGYLAGSIVISDGDARCELRDQIWKGPGADVGVTIVEHGAQFVLLVEKRNIFIRLVEDQFHQANECILACGYGYPGSRFHLLLRQLHEQLGLPFYLITANDPAGLELFFLIARGAAGRFSKPKRQIAIPGARFLGLRTADISRLGMGTQVEIKLGASEIQHLNRLKANPWLKSRPRWQEEIDQLLKRGSKVEMEALYAFSNVHVSKVYLPERLRAGDALSF